MKEDKKESSKAMGVRMWHSHRVTIVGVARAWSSIGRGAAQKCRLGEASAKRLL